MDRGALVTQINTSKVRGDLQVGDVILSVNGTDVRSGDDILSLRQGVEVADQGEAGVVARSQRQDRDARYRGRRCLMRPPAMGEDAQSTSRLFDAAGISARASVRREAL